MFSRVRYSVPHVLILWAAMSAQADPVRADGTESKTAQKPPAHPADAMPAQLQYEPAEVALAGRLTKQVFPGRPNYESIADGDEREEHFILKLAHPVSIPASPLDPDLNSAETNVRSIQIWAGPEEKGEEAEIALDRLMESFASQDVVVEATLSHGITVHHRTPLIAEVKQIKRKGAREFATPVKRSAREKARDEAKRADRKETELKQAGLVASDRPLPIELSYQHGPRIQLEGTLLERKVPAPSPNLLWVKDGVQTCWILELDRPVSAQVVHPSPDDQSEEHAVEGVKELQVTALLDDPLLRRNLRAIGIEPVDDPDDPRYQQLFGKRARITGWLTTLSSPVTPARLMAERLELLPPRP